MEDTDRHSKKELQDEESLSQKVENLETEEKPKVDLPAYQGNDGTADVPIEDMNSTMMSIDASVLQAEETRQNISVQTEPLDDEIIQEQLEEKKSFVVRLFKKFKKKLHDKKEMNEQESVVAKSTPPFFKKAFAGVWVAPEGSSKAAMAGFYLMRLVILVAGLFLQWALIKTTVVGFQETHPLNFVILTIVVVEILLVALALWRKVSANWFVALPLVAITSVFTLIVFLFHTRDPFLTSVFDESLRELVNPFLLFVAGYLLLVFLTSLSRLKVAKILWSMLMLLVIGVVAANASQNVSFENTLFGQGAFENIFFFDLTPSYLILQGILPLVFLYILVRSLWPAKTDLQKNSKGFALSLLPAMLVMNVFGVGVLQQNRIFHVGNFVMPLRLDYFEAQWFADGHAVQLQSRVEKAQDNQSRSKILWDYKEGEDQTPLSIVDFYGASVLKLKKSDLVLKVDGKTHNDFQFIDNPTQRVGSKDYILKINFGDQSQVLSQIAPKKTYSLNDKIEFRVKNVKSVAKVSVTNGESVLHEFDKEISDKISLSLDALTPGQHELTWIAFDEKQKEISRQSVSFNIVQNKSLLILAPLAEDAVDDQVTVQMQVLGIDPQTIEKVAYFVQGDLLQEVQGFISALSLDLSRFENQKLELEVKVKTNKEEFVKTIPVYKMNKTQHHFAIQSPTQGSYAAQDVLVAYELAGETSEPQRVLGIRVAVNGVDFQDFEVKENSFVLALQDWEQTPLFLTIQATLEDGSKLSDWVQINRDQAVLEMKFAKGVDQLFSDESLAVAIDASSSHVDIWDGMPKWDVYHELLSQDQVQAFIGQQDLKLWVAGSQSPFYQNNCYDVVAVSAKQIDSKADLAKQFKNHSPTGVSNVNAVLTRASKDKPRKVLLFTDAGSDCPLALQSSLLKDLQKDKVVVNVFGLGDLSSSEQKQLQKLAEQTNGHFYKPLHYKDLEEKFLEELSVKFELHQNGKLLQKIDLKDPIVTVPSGDYILRFPALDKNQEVEVSLKAGTKLLLEFSKVNKKIMIARKVSRMETEI